ncbi:MAG: TolC family protein, partial [Muribaculaceae bacterium]|nr:TolC family protein [Muribaculaceae bacterium]
GITAFPEEVLLPLADYRATMLAADPTLAAHSRLIDAANAGVSVNRAGRLPSFSLGYVHDYEEGFHFNGFSVGISLPSWGKNHSTSAAKAAAIAAGFEKENYAQSLEAGLVSDWYEASDLAIRLVPVKNEFADDNYLDLLSKSYDGGQLTIFEYLREINEYIDFKITLNELEHRYSTVVARLNRYNGTAVE